MALAQAGRPEDAAELREALRLEPGYPEAHSNLGNVLKDLGRRDEALENLKRAAELRPLDGAALSNLGLALAEAGRLRPQASDGHNNTGLALEALGRYKEAEAAHAEALRLDPASVDAHAFPPPFHTARTGNYLPFFGAYPFHTHSMACGRNCAWALPTLWPAPRQNRY